MYILLRYAGSTAVSSLINFVNGTRANFVLSAYTDDLSQEAMDTIRNIPDCIAFAKLPDDVTLNGHVDTTLRGYFPGGGYGDPLLNGARLEVYPTITFDGRLKLDFVTVDSDPAFDPGPEYTNITESLATPVRGIVWERKSIEIRAVHSVYVGPAIIDALCAPLSVGDAAAIVSKRILHDVSPSDKVQMFSWSASALRDQLESDSTDYDSRVRSIADHLIITMGLIDKDAQNTLEAQLCALMNERYAKIQEAANATSHDQSDQTEEDAGVLPGETGEESNASPNG